MEPPIAPLLLQSDSMVEINHIYGGRGDDNSLSASILEESKYRLLYSKSKVYVYPTSYGRDNIPGFVALVKRVCPLQRTRCTPITHHRIRRR